MLGVCYRIEYEIRDIVLEDKNESRNLYEFRFGVVIDYFSFKFFLGRYR